MRPKMAKIKSKIAKMRAPDGQDEAQDSQDEATMMPQMATCFALFLSAMDSFGLTPVCVLNWTKEIPLCQVFWRYMIDRDTFVDMPQDLSDKYEKHYRENTLDFEYDIYDPEGTVCTSHSVRVPMGSVLDHQVA